MTCYSFSSQHRLFTALLYFSVSGLLSSDLLLVLAEVLIDLLFIYLLYKKNECSWHLYIIFGVVEVCKHWKYYGNVNFYIVYAMSQTYTLCSVHYLLQVCCSDIWQTM